MRSDIVSDVPSQHPDFFEVGFYSEQKRLSPAIRKILRRHGYFSEGVAFLVKAQPGEIAASLKAAISKHLKSGQKVLYIAFPSTQNSANSRYKFLGNCHSVALWKSNA